MKQLFTAIWVMICIVVLFYGHSYWKEKTAVQAESKKSTIVQGKKSNQPSYDVLLSKAQNWPEPARQQFQQALEQNQQFKILFVGSLAIGNQDHGMLKDVIQQLYDAYGKNQLSISVHTYDLTSREFVAQNVQSEMATEKAQLIVFEPFLLNDNGKGETNDSITNLAKVIADVKAANPDTTIILQPSYPLFGAKYYPGQVAKLKQYAEQNQITYLDHWTAWPDSTNKELMNYLLPNESGPNDKGNQVWSQYLIHYLIHT